MKERKEIFVKYLFALSCGWDAVEIVWFKFLQGELKFAKHIEKFAHVTCVAHSRHKCLCSGIVLNAVGAVLSCVLLFATPWTSHSPPGSSVHGIFQTRILEQECHFLLTFLDPGIKLASPAPPAFAGGFFTIVSNNICVLTHLTFWSLKQAFLLLRSSSHKWASWTQGCEITCMSSHGQQIIETGRSSGSRTVLEPLCYWSYGFKDESYIKRSPG